MAEGTRGGPIAAYRELIRSGAIQRDPAQELTAETLQLLAHRLHGYAPPQGKGIRRWLGLNKRSEPPPGLYLHGGVGRGKSFLMDLFFEHVDVPAKRRVHFHAFMQEVHERIHRYRKDENPGSHTRDALPPVARRLAGEAWLLCFDELQVTDIADAMILGRLFARLFESGVVVVATSNRAPEELYKDGLNRELFLPFIDLMKQKLDVLHLDSPTDYRTVFLAGEPVFLTPVTAETTARLDRDFRHLVGEETPVPTVLDVGGRPLVVPLAARGVARASFDALCRQALGPGDYLALARAFHTLVLEGVPRLGAEDRNAAKRFVTLVDVLYEHKVKLLCTAEAAPVALGVERTVSRLAEMQSADYIARPHAGG